MEIDFITFNEVKFFGATIYILIRCPFQHNNCETWAKQLLNIRQILTNLLNSFKSKWTLLIKIKTGEHEGNQL